MDDPMPSLKIGTKPTWPSSTTLTPRAAADKMNDSQPLGEPVDNSSPYEQRAEKLNAELRAAREKQRERDATKQKKVRALKNNVGKRSRRRRAKREKALLDAAVRATNHGGWRPNSGRKPD